MRKMYFNVSKPEVDDYINELKEQLPDYDVNCNNANDFAIMLNEKQNCRSCNGLDFCQNEAKGCCYSYKDGGFSFVECKYKKQLKVKNSKQSLIKTLYLPEKILEARIEDFYVNSESRKKIYKIVNDFIINYDKTAKHLGLYLSGSFSKGKTFTLACIANELAKKDVSCLLIYFPDLVTDLKNALGTPRFESLLNMLKSVDVLMLDDLGSENMTPWVRDEILGPVLNYRVLENKALFVSSNIPIDGLKSHLAIDNSPSSGLKASRVLSRMMDSLRVISMDDGQTYKR